MPVCLFCIVCRISSEGARQQPLPPLSTKYERCGLPIIVWVLLSRRFVSLVQHLLLRVSHEFSVRFVFVIFFPFFPFSFFLLVSYTGPADDFFCPLVLQRTTSTTINTYQYTAAAVL